MSGKAFLQSGGHIHSKNIHSHSHCHFVCIHPQADIFSASVCGQLASLVSLSGWFVFQNVMDNKENSELHLTPITPQTVPADVNSSVRSTGTPIRPLTAAYAASRSEYEVGCIDFLFGLMP